MRLSLLFLALLPISNAQEKAVVAVKAPPVAERRLFFPHNWVRGYTDFEVAPSHNEPDLGRCAYPQPASAGGASTSCTAYARYLISLDQGGGPVAHVANGDLSGRGQGFQEGSQCAEVQGERGGRRRIIQQDEKLHRAQVAGKRLQAGDRQRCLAFDHREVTGREALRRAAAMGG